MTQPFPISSRSVIVLVLAAATAFATALPSAAERPHFTVTVQPQQPQVIDGQPATFLATTDPPGFEGEVQWKAVTRWGTATPETGEGPMFTVVFFDTEDGPCQWLAVRANDGWPDPPEPGEEWKQASTPDCIPDIFVPRGEDCWETDDCDTTVSFCTDPLPADFFESGSKQWRGEIPLKGPEEITVDTIVERLDDMSFPALDIRTTRVRLKKLDLESCAPFEVEYTDGTTKEWTVKVTESDFPPEDDGQMVVDRGHDNGGVFDSSFPLHIKYTFTKLEDPEVEVILDTGDPEEERDPLLMANFGVSPWAATIDPGSGVQTCGVNFHPGVRKRPTRPMCCKPVGHHVKGQKHIHKTGEKCKPCPDGACYNKKKLKCRMTVGPEPCDKPDEVYLGDSTDCRDIDRDGLLDWVEFDNCCVADQIQSTVCHSLSNRFDEDTDGDGMLDGDEVLAGRDPCTPDP